MDLSEEKAKEVLDFLARKAGFDNICVIKGKFNTNSFIIACGFLDKRIHICHVVCDTYWMPIEVCSSSYAKILEDLLEMSRDGKDILYASRKKPFLHAHTSLEEILIEIDLNA